MLSRVAENLFWIARYVERAENVARLIDAARRMTALPRSTGTPNSNEWASVLIASGAHEPFGEALDRVDEGAAIDRLMFDKSNPSSIASCLKAARENGRAIRFALTQEVWEALNTAWAEMRAVKTEQTRGGGLPDLVDWVKAKSAAFRGTMHGTMLRNDGYYFLEMGSAVERTDSTARLLDVKYHVLLPSISDVGSGTDHYQWLSLLQAAAAQRAYFAVTKTDISARGVAEFLLLNRFFPRSIVFNVRRAARTVGNISAYYGQEAVCQDAVLGMADRLEAQSIEAVFDYGLHEFLTDVVEQNYEIANLLGQSSGFAPTVEESDSDNDASGQ